MSLMLSSHWTSYTYDLRLRRPHGEASERLEAARAHLAAGRQRPAFLRARARQTTVRFRLRINKHVSSYCFFVKSVQKQERYQL